MEISTLLLQAIASFIAIVTFLIVLNVHKPMLLPGGLLGMATWLLYYFLEKPTNVIIATFIAAVIGACISQILSIVLKAPAIVFTLAVLAPLVPGYLSYKTTSLFVTGDYKHAIVNTTMIVLLALIISIGMASGTVFMRLYKYIRSRST